MSFEDETLGARIARAVQRIDRAGVLAAWDGPRLFAPMILAVVFLLTACGRAERERQAAVAATRAATLAEAQNVLAETVRSADRAARSADRILSPLPVMTPADEAALRRFTNPAHVERARRLGTRVADDEALDSLVAVGALVPLPDSTHRWIVRPGTSPAHVVPHVPAILDVLGTRFQDRLADMGLPPYRIEVTSALRTTERQARLRRSNANAAAGVSSHEFGTTVDVSYAAFAPPATPPVEIRAAGLPNDFRPSLERVVDLAFESVSARKSRELGRIFSQVLREAQDQGLVVVIYERQQTVYHLTVARALTEG